MENGYNLIVDGPLYVKACTGVGEPSWSIDVRRTSEPRDEQVPGSRVSQGTSLLGCSTWFSDSGEGHFPLR